MFSSIPIIRQLCPAAYGISPVFGDTFKSKHPTKPTLGKYSLWIDGAPWFQWVCFDNAGRWATAGTAKEAYRLYGYAVKPKIKRLTTKIWVARSGPHDGFGMTPRAAYHALRAHLKQSGYHPLPPPLKRRSQART